MSENERPESTPPAEGLPPGDPTPDRPAPRDTALQFLLPAPSSPPPALAEQWWPGCLLVAMIVAAGILGAILFRGQLGDFMVAGLETVPFALLAFLAYLGVRHLWARVLAVLWLGMLVLGTAGVALLLVFGSKLGPRATLLPGAGEQLLVVAAMNLVGILAAIAPAAQPVRERLARFLPFDEHSPVHAIALSLVAGATVISLGQLVATGGRPVLLTFLKNHPEVGEGEVGMLSMVYGFVWMLPAGLVAAGFPVVRNLKECLRRLGFVQPTKRQLLGAIGLAVLLVGIGYPMDLGVERIWKLMHWPQTDEKLFEKLLGAAISPAGAVVIGVTAGVGEEMIVRGALQPRLGILVSNLFFTSIHAYQYGFDALLGVFFVGWTLGIVRARTNTTTSAVVHGVYDFILVMIAVAEKHA